MTTIQDGERGREITLGTSRPLHHFHVIYGEDPERDPELEEVGGGGSPSVEARSADPFTSSSNVILPGDECE